MADAALRTEPATPKRRADARREGQVVVSPEIAPAATLAALVVTTTAGAPIVVAHARTVLTEWLAAAGPVAAHEASLVPLLSRTGHALAAGLAPLFVVVVAVAVVAGVAQAGWRPRPALVLPDVRRIGLAAGRTRIASQEGVARLVRAIAKTVLVAAIVSWVLTHLAPQIADASALPGAGVADLTGASVRALGVALVVGLGLVGAGDWAWARWRHERALRMSRSELRAERRERDGDPHVRARFRRARHERAKGRMLDAVATADVVLAQPDELAVALRYRAGETSAPRVVAKGRGATATAIERAAHVTGVPLVARRWLAADLFRTVPLGGVVPPARYRDVADVLAWAQTREAGA
jgi:flagellar biosynthetic protein FlhB